MTTEIEIVDALPGCGKTYAIFDYIAQNQDKPWLYLTPLLSEVNERVQIECQRVALDFYCPNEHEDTKTEQALKVLQEGGNLACTHALMLRFTDEHIQEIIKNQYNIVCDEELNLISTFKIKKADVEHLQRKGIIQISDTDGKVTFMDQEMSDDARYGDVKLLANMECLFSSKRSANMMVVQVSPKLVKAASRFVLLTYNYTGSVMQTFMQMHGFNDVALDLKLRFSSEDARQGLKQVLEILDSPAIRSCQRNLSLSSRWWENASVVERQQVGKTIRTLIKSSKLSQSDCFFTFPKDYIVTKTSVLPRNISKDNFVTCSTRSTNNYNYKKLGVHAYNLYVQLPVKIYMQEQGFTCDDDTYALNMLLQWLFRGCVRENQLMKIAVLSKRMNGLLKEWLYK